MTTVATDGLSMAGDGQREHRGTIVTSAAEKVRRLSDGRIVGTAGCVATGIKAVKWLEGGGDAPDFPSDVEFSALILYPTGIVEMMGHECVLMPVALPFAIGSGMDLAIGAMEAGADPAKAVLIASMRDPGTGGVITSIERPSLTVARQAA